MHKQMRSALFVPATRPERFLKALGTGADMVIIDLEDAVERDNKDQARRHLTEFAQSNPDVSFLVRVNGATTSWFESDLAACGHFANIVGILLPKAESAG
ncbi:MAG TPA: aldolase/citrate lyase family protein, partial [Paralcaligenes sp.]